MHFLLKYNILQNGNGGVRNCGGVALAYGPDGPNGPNGQDGRARLRPDGLRRGKPRYTPGVCRALCGLARGVNVPQGYNSKRRRDSLKSQPPLPRVSL